jgi:photosystem II stability/assembly factor-like uncharacterized protein
MAQWKNVAPNLLAPFIPGFGAVYYADGLTWVGNSKLWCSPDTGKTWQQMSYSGGSQIRDIYFLDKLHGLVASEESGVYLTHDGGNTWKQIIDGEAWEVSFNGSKNIIHVLMTAPAQFCTSLDGGTTWSYKHLGTYGMSFAIARNGMIHVLSGERYQTSSRGWVNSTSDYGVTWTNNGGTVDGDSYTLSVDSCDPKRLYLVNEDYASSLDGVSQFFTSTNAGLSWVPGFGDTGLFFNGSLATTKNSMYAGTVLNQGIFRSTDRGMTWLINGGPAIGYDSRSIFPVNDNLVFALSLNGSVWMTQNSGGDSLAIAISDVDAINNAVILYEDKTSVAPLDTVQINIRVRFPSGSGINTISPDEITYVVHFNENVIGIAQADLEKNVIPPAGWAFKDGLVSSGSVSVTLRNTSGAALQFVQNLGKIAFTALAAPMQQTTISVNRLEISSACNSYVASFGLERGLLKTIVIATKHVAITEDEKDILVFPNPVKGSLMLQSQTDIGNASIELYDELGKKHFVLQLRLMELEPNPIDVSSLPNGNYYLRIEGLEFKATKRIVINK